MNLDEPFFTLGTIDVFNQAYQSLLDWTNATKTKNVSFQTFETMSAKIPAIKKCRHTHGNDDTGASSGETLFTGFAAL